MKLQNTVMKCIVLNRIFQNYELSGNDSRKGKDTFQKMARLGSLNGLNPRIRSHETVEITVIRKNSDCNSNKEEHLHYSTSY